MEECLSVRGVERTRRRHPISYEMKALQNLTTVFAALCLLAVGCGRKPVAPSADAVRVDSFLRRHMDSIYAAPARTDSLMAAMQRTVADSTAYYRLELFRAVIHNLGGDSESVARSHRAVLSWCGRNPDAAALEGQLWNHRGVMDAIRSQYDSACADYARAYAAISRSSDRRELISVCINMADAQFWAGRVPRAAEFYRRALFVADSLDSESDYFPIYAGLGQVYTELENFKEAHRYFSKARPLLPSVTQYEVFHYYLSLGNCFYYEKRYPEALSAFRHGHRVAEALGNPLFLTQAEVNLGEVLLLLGNKAEARHYISRCEQFVRQHPDTDPSVRFYVSSLAADLALAEGRTADAGRLLAQPFDTSQLAVRYLELHYSRLQRYAEQQGDYRTAYRYQQRARDYADTLRNRQAVNNVAEFTFRYAQDTTLLRQRIALSDYAAKTSRQRTYIVAAVVLLVALTLAAVAVVVNQRRRNERRYRRQLDRMTRLRMDVARNRMSPHYIFNVLGAALPRFRAYPELTGPLELLIDVLRGNLLASGRTSVRIDEEINLVKRYVELRQLSSGPYPAVRWSVAENVPTDVRVPAMCLQIPVENALKHAFTHPDASSVIDVEVRFTGEGVRLTVTDNGEGFRPGGDHADDRSTGTGLRVLSQTIDLLNRRNSRPLRFEIRSQQPPSRGTVVEFFVPVGYHFPAGDEE